MEDGMSSIEPMHAKEAFGKQFHTSGNLKTFILLLWMDKYFIKKRRRHE